MDELNDWERQALAAYVADYITEELRREGIGFDVGSFMVRDAIDAYYGGAGEDADAANNPRILGQIFGG